MTNLANTASSTATPTPGSTAVQFYFDPGCPWTWITSRWLVEVAQARDLQITWQLFSLRYHNKDNPGYDWIRAALDDQHPAMRILAATKQKHGNAAVGKLYTTLGTWIHHDDDEHLTRLPEALAAAGLPADIINEGANEKWDAIIEESTRNAYDIIGKEAGVPLIVIDGSEHSYFGPVLSPAPTGEDALKLWDTYVALGSIGGVYEIKRTRETGPQLPARPLLG
ncbi:MAG TPA: DsbA family protein [Ilumatobacteraceae bacterium]|nr:DsbA family protein [Ilumatobacteraceae bacterium]